MLLKVSRLGVIKEAEIDLDKNLIVFCGPNNSGKTYLAYTIHGLHAMRQNVFDLLGDSSSIWQEISTNKQYEVDLFSLIKSYYHRITGYVENFADRLPDIFATDTKLFRKTIISLTIDNWDVVRTRIENASYNITFNGYRNSRSIRLVKEKGSTLYSYQSLRQDGSIAGIDNYTVGDIEPISSIFQFFITSTIFPDTSIFPTERTAVSIFSKELSIKRNELVDQLFELKDKKGKKEDAFAFLERRATRYTLPIRSSLAIAEDMAALRKKESPFSWLADDLEQTILNGKVDISKDGEMFFTPRNSKKRLNLHVTASMVKSLSSIVFYFRHLAAKNDLIIIDEPELNLHPDNQRKIARFLAKVVNAGFKVLISTHSDYIIRELNNLIMLNKGTEEATKLMDKFGYDKTELLDNRQVGVYLFHDSPRKGVEEIEVTESGFEVESIDKTIHDLNESSQEIYLSLF